MKVVDLKGPMEGIWISRGEEDEKEEEAVTSLRGKSLACFGLEVMWGDGRD